MIRSQVAILTLIALCGAANAQETTTSSSLKVNKKATESSEMQASESKPFTLPQNTTSREKSPLNNPDVVVMATWDGGKLDNREVSSTLAMRKAGNTPITNPDDFNRLTYDQQVEIVKTISLEKIAAQKGRAAGIDESTPIIRKAISREEEQILGRIYYQEEISKSLEKATADTARKFYDDNKSTMFTQPAETIIRALHISTYEMVTAEKGDTLNGLAEKFTGSREAASLIREANPPYYMRQPAPEVSDKVLSSPLRAGEVLYIPMGKTAQTSASALASDLREQLLAGKSIDDVAATKRDDFTVSATAPIQIQTGIGYYDEILKASQELKTTSVSQPIKTPTGITILQVEDRRTTTVISYDSVKPQLVQRVTSDDNQRRQTVELTRKTVLDELWKKYGVEVNHNALSRANYLGTDPLTTDSMIAKVGDYTYTLEDYLIDLRRTGKDWGQLSQPERLEIVQVAPSITDHVIAMHARELGMDQRPEFKEAIAGFIDAQIASEYKRRTEDPNDNKVTTAELQAYYNDHLDRYTSAAQVTIREISKRINMTLPGKEKTEAIEKAKGALTEIRGRIKNQEDFAQLARRESEAISTRSRGGLIGTVSETFRGEAFKNQLRQLKPGEISEPFLYGSEVLIVRLDDRLAPTVQPFEQIRARVMMDYAATEPAKNRKKRIDAILSEAGFKIAF